MNKHTITLNDTQIERLKRIQTMIEYCGYGGSPKNSRGSAGDAKLLAKIIDQTKPVAAIADKPPHISAGTALFCGLAGGSALNRNA